MADVVQQRGQLQARALRGVRPHVPCVLQGIEHAAGEVIGAERVLEAAMRGARVHQERMAQLPHVAQSLYGGGVDHGERFGVEPDVVPERVADDLEPGQRAGPASRTAACTCSRNCSKF